MNLPGRKKPQENEPGESDALKGNYALQDWLRRTDDLRNLPKDETTTDGKFDSQQRDMVLVTNGHNAIGTDYPITAQNEAAYQKLKSIQRFFNRQLSAGNHMKTAFNSVMSQIDNSEVPNRSTETSHFIPTHVLSYKPVIRDSSGVLENQNEEAERDKQNAQKRP